MTSWKMILFLSIVTIELLVVLLLLTGYINDRSHSPSAEINATTLIIKNMTVTPTPTPTPAGWYYNPETGHFVESGKG